MSRQVHVPAWPVQHTLEEVSLMDSRAIGMHLKKELEKHYGKSLKNVILYGSSARGEATEESDIDILVVLDDIENYDREFNTVFTMEREIEKKHSNSILISSLVASQADYERNREPLFQVIRQDGIAL